MERTNSRDGMVYLYDADIWEMIQTSREDGRGRFNANLDLQV